MKKLLLLIITVTLCLSLSGLGSLSHATSSSTPPPPPPSGPPPETDSPAMLDTKPELAIPKPQPPMDLRAPGDTEDKAKTTPEKTKPAR